MTIRSTTVADLQLGRAGVMEARLHWPVDGSAAARLLVLFPARTSSGAIADQLCRRGCGLMVLVAWCRTVSDAVWTVEWAADHAADLGAAGSAVVLVGDGRGSDLAIAAARHASASGWPVISRVVLIDPPDRTDVRGAHVIDGRDDADVATELAAHVEGIHR